MLNSSTADERSATPPALQSLYGGAGATMLKELLLLGQ